MNLELIGTKSTARGVANGSHLVVIGLYSKNHKLIISIFRTDFGNEFSDLSIAVLCIDIFPVIFKIRK